MKSKICNISIINLTINCSSVGQYCIAVQEVDGSMFPINLKIKLSAILNSTVNVCFLHSSVIGWQNAALTY